MKALIGQKIGMTQLFDEEGNVVPVTLIQAGPCVVTQVKTAERDGYNAVQLGFGQAKRLSQPLKGHLKAAKSEPRHLREFRVEPVTPDEGSEADMPQLKVGQSIDAGIFSEGDDVVVVGTSKGKGFAGAIKRHNFHRGPKTHGSHHYRARGSVGAMYPQHVFKGLKMAGQMGHERVSVKGLKVIKVDSAQNLVAVSGAVPGPRKGLIMLRSA